jgi:ATP-dependent RNA helicase RhlE
MKLLAWTLLSSQLLTTSLAFSSHPLSSSPFRTQHQHNNIRLSSSSLSSSALEHDDDDDTKDETVEIRSFADLGLSPQILSGVKAQQGWDRPTPVQMMAIPQLLQLGPSSSSNNNNNKDKNNDADKEVDAVWCEAPTGSGKTAAYVLPLLQNIQRRGRIASLILCPTRELAAQIGQVVQNVAANCSNQNNQRKQVMVLHGGTPLRPQIDALSDYARFGETLDVVVATPGRLVDVLTYYQDKDHAKDGALERRLLEALDDKERGTDASLSLDQLEKLKLKDILEGNDSDGRDVLINLLEDLQYLVLDEADRLLGRAFESELTAVLDLLPPQISTWMFSATFPKSIEPRLDQVLKRIGTQAPIRIECAHSDRLSLAGEAQDDISSSLQKKLERSTTVSSASKLLSVGPASTIEMRAIRLEKRDRTQALRRLLEENPEWDRVLVFVATRYAAEHVSAKLRRAGIKSMELHGKLDQDARVRRLSDLKRGKIRVLLATDIASRGLDIVGLPVMVNYDLPRSTADFVHRVGRTGRAGKEGTAITFVTAGSESHMEVIEKRHLVEPIEREVLKGFEPDEKRWIIEAQGSRIGVPGTTHSDKGLAHDRMVGGVKGRRKSKKDRLREAAAKKAATSTN